MKKIFLFFITTLLLLSISCAPSGMTINPKYSKARQENLSHVIYLIPKTINIKDASIVNDYLGEGDPLKVYGDFVRSQIPVSLKKVTMFKNLTCVDSASSLVLHESVLITSKSDTLSIMLPENGGKLEFNGQIPDVRLFVQDLTSELKQSFHYNKQGGYTSPVLAQMANCVFWDNSMGDIISYGKVKSEVENFFPTISKKLWVKGVDLFAYNLVKSGPFYYKTNKIE